MKKILLAMSMLAGLAGCAGSAYDIAKRHDALRDYKGADAGFVVASEGGERGGHFHSSGVSFERVGTNELVSFWFATAAAFSRTPEHDFEAGSAIGTVQPMRLPPGEYVAVEVQGDTPNIGSSHRPLRPGLRFTVKTGETVYLGRYIVGASGFNPILFISEHQDEDMAIARKRMPEMPADAVTSAVPPAGSRQF